MTTSGLTLAPTRALVVLFSAGAALLAHGSRAAAAAPTPSAPPPIIFFWSSPSRADAEARPALFSAVEAGARPGGGRVLDLSPPSASPPDTASRVSRAITAYDAMRFADTIADLDAAATAAAETGAWGLARDALVDLFLYRALSKTEAGDEAGAWNDFVRAATIDASRILDPARFRPTAIKSFKRAVAEVSARALAPLTVRAPAGSRIFIDGRPVGRDQVSEPLLPGEHYVRVERPSGPALGRTVTLAGALELAVPDEVARPPDDAELIRRAARLGAGAPLLVAVSRQGGIAVVELRSLERRGGVLRGAVRLGPSPAAHARDLTRSVERALGELAATGAAGADLSGPAGGGQAPERRWYQNRWLWLAAGAAGALLAVSPLLFDSSGGSATIPARLPTDDL